MARKIAKNGLRGHALTMVHDASTALKLQAHVCDFAGSSPGASFSSQRTPETCPFCASSGMASWERRRSRDLTLFGHGLATKHYRYAPTLHEKCRVAAMSHLQTVVRMCKLYLLQGFRILKN